MNHAIFSGFDWPNLIAASAVAAILVIPAIIELWRGRGLR